jgi:hypothetical protein
MRRERPQSAHQPEFQLRTRASVDWLPHEHVRFVEAFDRGVPVGVTYTQRAVTPLIVVLGLTVNVVAEVEDGRPSMPNVIVDRVAESVMLMVG